MVSCCYYFQLAATEKKGVVRAYIAVERERGGVKTWFSARCYRVHKLEHSHSDKKRSDSIRFNTSLPYRRIGYRLLCSQNVNSNTPSPWDRQRPHNFTKISCTCTALWRIQRRSIMGIGSVEYIGRIE